MLLNLDQLQILEPFKIFLSKENHENPHSSNLDDFIIESEK